MLHLQRDSHSCGPVALANAVIALGKKVSVKAVRKHTSTTPKEGTLHWGLMIGLERLGFQHTELSGTFPECWKTLYKHLRDGGSAILLTQQGEHWEAAVGVLGRRVLVFDQQPSSGSSGVSVLSRGQMMRYWTANGQEGRYAILISK